ncbi:MAG: acyl-CoA dehydrogenase family protein [Acidimicrobiales bacterium]|nr:acyl-CoA dehydrogenase family protein [Acidimicrobiales bacterium]
MDFAFTPEQVALRQELREYFTALMTPEVEDALAETGWEGPLYKELVRQIGRDGWLGVGWPKEYGGQGRTPMEQLIFFDEVQRANAPVPMLAINTVGPTIMRFGNDEQKARFLPPILAGELHFAIGYTEPGAGTDLASLRTAAVRDGDEYVVNGQKVFTTQVDVADWLWLAVRTDPDAPKHKGISILLMPTDAPGFSHTPIHVMGEGRTNATYYQDVRIPVANLVGEENAGWRLITTQLNHERVALCNAGAVERIIAEVRRWAQDTKLADGRRVIDQDWVRLNLARATAETEALRLMNLKVAWSLQSGDLKGADASAMKVFGTESDIRVNRWLMEILGSVAYLARESPEAALHGRLEKRCQSALIRTFGGGATEIQRDIIAMQGLGLPRAPR